MMIAQLDLFSIAICVVFLAFGSWSDLRTREVSNKLWAVSLPVSAAITVIRISLSTGLVLLYFASISISILVSIAIFEAGFFGGADAKAMICLGVALPLSPSIFHPIFGYFHPFFPLVVLTNGFLISLLSVLYVVGRNLRWKLRTKEPLFQGFESEPFLKKVLVAVSGYKVALAELRRRPHLIPMEDVDETDGEPQRTIRIFAGAEADTEAPVERLERYNSTGLVPDLVWITPGLPMLVFLSFGFVASLVLGDVLFHAILSAAKSVFSA
jgi:preflagellin peptidase FlaK